MFKKTIILPFLLIVSMQALICQNVDSVSYKTNPRFSFYSFENNAEILLHVPQKLISFKTEVSLLSGNNLMGTWQGIPGKTIVRIPFELGLIPGNYEVVADIRVAGRSTKYISKTDLTILEYKSNEVKTDRFSGGLIVNKRQFFPFGFYCYSPVHPALPEEEVVKGFNMISPYQRILPETVSERKAYMDRCAELGMKVHYNVLSVTGGGGVGSQIQDITEEQKKERLINEILTFRDHPALLAWYIADEPTGHKVTIVFMAPFLASKDYSDALDIVMADPYPVPDMPVTLVGNVAGQLAAEFSGKRPVWIVPQAFGGGEWWGREPSLQEMRSMTYQAVIRGARGIQYFIRQGLNFFPKSTAAWGECGRMAVEIAELTPWLLSDEETIRVRSASQDIIVTSAVHENQLLILAVNKTNAPKRAEYFISGMVPGRAKVVFENRSVTISGGYFSDQLSAYGSQAYMIDLKPRSETIKPYPGNLIRDPGFEDTSSPGVPASCYARNGGDRGATYFLDSRDHVEGNHSIRLVTPKENRGVRLRFFPVQVMNGKNYLISVWARTDTDVGSSGTIDAKPKVFEITFGEGGTRSFRLENEWRQFVTIVTIPHDSQLPARTNLILQLKSAGVAWFDMLQVIECYDIKQSINPELNWYQVK